MTGKRAHAIGKVAAALRKMAMPQSPMFGKLRGNPAMATGYGAAGNGGNAVGGGLDNNAMRMLKLQRSKASPTGTAGQAMTTPQPPQAPALAMRTTSVR